MNDAKSEAGNWDRPAAYLERGSTDHRLVCKAVADLGSKGWAPPVLRELLVIDMSPKLVKSAGWTSADVEMIRGCYRGWLELRSPLPDGGGWAPKALLAAFATLGPSRRRHMLSLISTQDAWWLGLGPQRATSGLDGRAHGLAVSRLRQRAQQLVGQRRQMDQRAETRKRRAS